MANVKISQLPSATTPLSGLEEIAIVQNNQTVKTTAESIRGGYKVYTALLTQSGGDNLGYLGSDDIQPMVIGVTYTITDNDGTGDFTNVGAPNNIVGTSFVATGTTPNNWGTYGMVFISYNTGAPVTTVLENTLGKIWFIFNGDGEYSVFSDDLFTLNKTFITIGSAAEGALNGIITSAVPATTSYMYICSAVASTITPVNDDLFNTSFEIRVYN